MITQSKVWYVACFLCEFLMSIVYFYQHNILLGLLWEAITILSVWQFLSGYYAGICDSIIKQIDALSEEKKEIKNGK